MIEPALSRIYIAIDEGKDTAARIEGAQMACFGRYGTLCYADHTYIGEHLGGQSTGRILSRVHDDNLKTVRGLLLHKGCHAPLDSAGGVVGRHYHRHQWWYRIGLANYRHECRHGVSLVLVRARVRVPRTNARMRTASCRASLARREGLRTVGARGYERGKELVQRRGRALNGKILQDALAPSLAQTGTARGVVQKTTHGLD